MGSIFMQPMGRKKRRLGDILVTAGIITDEQLMQALEMQKDSIGKKLGATLIECGMTTETDIAHALQQQLHMEFVNIAQVKIPDTIISMVNESVLRKHILIPYEFDPINTNVLKVAMADPLNLIAIDDISIVTNYQVEPVVATPTEITQAIDRYYGNAEAMKVAEEFSKERQEQMAGKDKDKEKEEDFSEDIKAAPIVKLVNQIIEQGVRSRASDIHIEPFENEVRIRYRIDGALHEQMRHRYDIFAALIARIKIIGGMDISEKRKPQDGRITSVVDRMEYDIRVSVLPTVYGEKVVMRLTSKEGLTKDKKDLGFSDSELKSFDEILKNPHGIILVTGPTGSGKSTTLYTALSELNKEDVNIITVEDPVEANIDGINQVQVNNKADMTFAAALRSILRQDPDIIMIGEIRDGETAEIAVKASITGHLVVSTLHTNSAASTITRLADMGIESYLIADSVVGVIAQRLVRRLCPHCKKEKRADEFEKEILGIDRFENAFIYEPSFHGVNGHECSYCGNAGYRGRIGVYEIMKITPKLKVIISKNSSADDIKEQALKEGMHTLRMSATKYVLDGVTSLSEMVKVSFEN